MIDLGTVRPGSTVRIPFSSFDKDDGSSITMTNFAVGDILIYKDGSTTERASTSGYTATTDFDSKTGKHLIVLDLSDNTTSGFWNAGSEYLVAIDAVTVDAVTTGGWFARFRIGYPDAMLDTTIATLASQTSFTLTSGPAEDDALNDQWAIIHDIASGVQCAKVLILDYTGSTRTVTLAAGATFTVAAGDNISIMGPAPLQPTTLGRRLDVSTGGEAGIDWANVGSPTTTVNLSATTISTSQAVASVSGAVGSVTGSVGSISGVTFPSNFAALAITVGGAVTAGTVSDKTGYAISGTTTTLDALQTALNSAHGSGSWATATGFSTHSAADVWSVGTRTITGGTITTYTGNTPQTGDAYALAANGTYGLSAIKALLDVIAVYIDTEVAAIKAKTDNLPATPASTSDIPSAVANASAVRTELATELGRLDAAVSTRLATSGYTAPLSASGVRDAVGLAAANLDTQLAALDALLDSILDDTGTAGVAISAAVANKIADHVRRRTQANVEASSDGDTLSVGSLYGLIQQAQESSVSGGTLTIKKTDGSTTLGTKTVTSSASADPITGIG